MKVRKQAARDKPFVSRIEIFDYLMSISFMSKALAFKVLCLPKDKFKQKGGKSDVKKDKYTQRPRTKQS